MKKNFLMGRTALQSIALITMLCDHIAFIFVDSLQFPELYQAMRIVGRISFVLFSFMLVEGFLHTHNLRKYLSRILLFAFLSELPFDLAFYHTVIKPDAQNVMFTLFIALLVLIGLARFASDSIMKAIILLAGCGAAIALKTDYSYTGIILIALFYLLHQQKALLYLLLCLYFVLWGGLEIFAILALPFCILYQPDKEEKPLPKYFCYGFYPVHLLVLWGISLLLIR